MAVDADDRQGDALVMTIDPVAVIVMRTREANHLPRRQVFVAAVDRIGEKAALRVLEDLGEKRLAVEAVKLERTVLQPLDHAVFLLVGQSGKRFTAEFVAAGDLESGKRLAVLL